MFNLAARFGGLYIFKFADLLFDLASRLLRVLLLRARGEPLMRVLVYGWCPLVILEFAGSARIDSAMIALLRTIPGGRSVRRIGLAWLVTLPLGLVNGLVFYYLLKGTF